MPRRELRLHGQRKGSNRIVTISDGQGTLLGQGEGEQIGVALERLVKDYKVVRRIYSLSETQLPGVYLLDQWVVKGMNFIAWWVEERKSVILLVSPILESIHDDLSTIEELVDLALLLNVGRSCRYEGSKEHKITRLAHGSLRIVTSLHGEIPSYVGAGDNLATAIAGVAKIIR